MGKSSHLLREIWREGCRGTKDSTSGVQFMSGESENVEMWQDVVGHGGLWCDCAVKSFCDGV
jgi:hypothetical protein